MQKAISPLIANNKLLTINCVYNIIFMNEVATQKIFTRLLLLSYPTQGSHHTISTLYICRKNPLKLLRSCFWMLLEILLHSFKYTVTFVKITLAVNSKHLPFTS